MIERGLHLQKAITQFHDLWLEGDDEGKLLQEDWDTLKKVRGSPGLLLSLSTHITANIDFRLPSWAARDLVALESSTSTLDDVLPAMDYILELFEAKKVEFKDDSVLGPCMNSGWSKLVKYYDKTSYSLAYVAALVLNPAYK